MKKNVLWLVLACILEIALITFSIAYAVLVSPMGLVGAIIPIGLIAMIIFYLIKGLRY